MAEGEGVFSLGEVADADLNKFFDLRNLLESVIHYRRVRLGEALVSGAKVAVGVEVEDT